MKKKLLTVALAAVMVVSSAFSAMAELVSADTTFTGKVADGSAGWASAGTGVTFPIDENGVTVVFKNDGLVRDTSNWSNFIIETIATDAADGVTLRADAYGWTYEKTAGTKVNTATYAVTTTWGDDWTGFAALTDDTTVTLNAKKTDANTVVFDIKFASDAAANEVYTITYPDGVPSGLEFQVGADGGKVELVSATFGSASSEDTTTAGSGSEAGTTAGTTGGTTTTPDTGDSTMVLALVAVAVASAVVVLKKRTVTE